MFQDVLRAVREIRARQGVPVKEEIRFVVKCDAQTAKLLEPMRPYFLSMASAAMTASGEDVPLPEFSSNATGANWEVGVDLAGFINVEAELEKHRKNHEKLAGLIASKLTKLSNENFISRAPAPVVAAERASLADMEEQLKAAEEAIRRLEK